jgi:hypothetical protein
MESKSTVPKSSKKVMNLKSVVISSASSKGKTESASDDSGSSNEEDYEDIASDYEDTEKAEMLDMSGDGDFEIDC